MASQNATKAQDSSKCQSNHKFSFCKIQSTTFLIKNRFSREMTDWCFQSSPFLCNCRHRANFILNTNLGSGFMELYPSCYDQLQANATICWVYFWAPHFRELHEDAKLLLTPLLKFKIAVFVSIGVPWRQKGQERRLI